jgi:hypothetical protein
MTITELAARFPKWEISDGPGGGWYAVRRVLISPSSRSSSALSNVRCGNTLDELARHLAEEAQLEARISTWPPKSAD